MKRFLAVTAVILLVLTLVFLANREITKPLPTWPEPTELTQDKPKRTVTRTQPVSKTRKDPRRTKLTIKVHL